MEIKIFLEKEDILKVLKETSLNKFKVYANNYMSENLEVNGKYTIREIHKIVSNNLIKGVKEFLADNNVDYAIWFDVFNISTWYITLHFELDLISIWEDIGRYFIKWRTRKNASISNDSIKLDEIPYFDFVNMEELEENNVITLYDLLVYHIEKKRKIMVERYEKEIEDMYKNIESNKDLIKKVKEIKGI